LPRDEVVIDIEDHDCPCCGSSLQPIGKLHTEQLDIALAQLRVRVTRRPRYVRRTCDGVIVVAPAPERPVDGGMATEALIMNVVVSKFVSLKAPGPSARLPSVPSEPSKLRRKATALSVRETGLRKPQGVATHSPVCVKPNTTEEGNFAQ
jgi:zinc-finger binding domain of transposase IS66